MKKSIIIITATILMNLTLQAQDKGFEAGGGFIYSLPAGSLGDRFLSAPGFEVHLGKETSEKWFWSGKIEYYKFDKGNEDKFLVRREVELNGSPVLIETKLKNLEIELEIIGVTANAHYRLIKGGIFEGDIKFGFGLYRWYYHRGEYNDTLLVDNGSGQNVNFPLNAPGISQSDWSGGANVGIESRVKLIDPLLFYLGADYNIVIAEIWPALTLGLENISTFQLLNIRAGIKIEF